MARVKLSTTNNPFNPFIQYDKWEDYDQNVCEYYSNSYLARIAATSPDLSGAENEQAIEDAVDEIVEMDLPIFDPFTNERVHYVKVKDPN